MRNVDFTTEDRYVKTNFDYVVYTIRKVVEKFYMLPF